jgi:hypothetical protein
MNAPYAKFLHSNLENARLINANIRDSIFDKSKIKYANFENAVIDNATIDNRNLSPTKAYKYTILDLNDNPDVISEEKLSELLDYSIGKKRHNEILEQSIKANVFGKYSLLIAMLMAIVSLIISINNFFKS